ncbi:hypothetical protein [Pseudomonas sp. 3A(2025)]
MSKIIESLHKDMLALYRAGLISKVTMREFEAIAVCASPGPSQARRIAARSRLQAQRRR